MKIDHEEIYRDGKHYDALNNFNHDVPFYLEMAKSYGEKTLELACGTGRITLPLAEQGIERKEELNMRMFFPQELENYLRYTGFQIENKFGNYDQSSFTNDSGKKLLLAN